MPTRADHYVYQIDKIEIEAFPHRQDPRWIKAMSDRVRACQHNLVPRALTMTCTKCYFTRAMTDDEIARRPKP